MTTKTWTGITGSGSWFDPGNWDPPGVPQTGDEVTIAGAAVTIPAPATGRNNVTVASVNDTMSFIGVQ